MAAALPAPPPERTRGLGIAGQLDFGNNVLIAHGGRRTTDLAAAELDEYALGVQHGLSKRTHVYAGYQHVDFKLDALEDADTVALGLRHDVQVLPGPGFPR
ncbi:porin-like protein [Plasticicumulans lactativorans]|uniref:Porin-like protein n=1 Tax=Plasticicumulans lactativorans TaxID=1133106 RepID=A0A4R2L364_9GAMM|nr:porin [Plasticicumulans lactativorans]TCO79667.1 porin-like protein [Plasticicumulans lactativorans]